MNESNILEPRHVPLWAASAFVLALLALVIALAGLYRIQASAALTQAEIITLNRHIAQLKANGASPPAMAQGQGQKPPAPEAAAAQK